MKKHGMIFVLCLLMLAGVFFGAAPVRGASLTQSSDGYYRIYTADDLYAFAAMVNGGSVGINGRLMNDITVNQNVLSSDGALNGDGTNFRVWTPMGSDWDSRYNGSFDGNNKTIFGLYVNNSNADHVGLFGYTGSSCTVKDLEMADSYFCGKNYVGSVVGENSYAVIRNCRNGGTVIGSSHVGGLIGMHYNSYEPADNMNCGNTGTVFGNSYVGGITGENLNYIYACTNFGKVSGDKRIGGISGDGGVKNSENSGTVFGKDYVGGVIGYGQAIDCANAGAVSGSGTCTGGVVGYMDMGSRDCVNTGDVSGKGSVGGVAGSGSGSVANCHNTGSVFGTTEVGGLVGSGMSADTCGNTGTVFGETAVGGIVGYTLGTVKNCRNIGTVSGKDRVGGIAGRKIGYGITNNCSSGKVSGSGIAVGGILGYIEEGGVTNCYFRTDTAAKAIGCNVHSETMQVEGKTAAQFASGHVTYLLNKEVTDGTQIWYQTLGTDTVPAYIGMTVYAVTAPCCTYANTARTVSTKQHTGGTATCDSNAVCTVCGEHYDAAAEHTLGSDGFCVRCDSGFQAPSLVADSYEIRTAAHLYWFAQQVNSGNNGINGRLMNDITVNETMQGTDLRVWTPIGNYNTPYRGNFDGNGKTVSGLYFDDSTACDVGLFGYTWCDITNVGVKDSYLCGHAYVGGVVGSGDYVDIKGCYNEGVIFGDLYVGGIVGCGSAQNCYNLGDITGEENVGGIVGKTYAAGNVIGCYNAGRVIGRKYAGSLIGYALPDHGDEDDYYGRIDNCYVLEGTADEFFGDGSITVTHAEVVGADRLASGEIAYLLNGGLTDGTQVWYQTLGTHEAPVFFGGAVYLVSDCQGNICFGNTEGAVVHAYSNGACTDCGTPCSHNYVKGSCTVCKHTPKAVTITKQPGSVSAYNGKTAKVTVVAEGDGLTYRWYYANKGSSKFTYTSSFKTNSYSLSMSAARSGRKVYCVITDKYGNSVQTKTVTLTQRTWLKITKQPVSVSAYKGKTAKVTVGVQGDGLTYKWYYANKGSSKFTYTSSFKMNSYSLSMSAARSGRKVYCVITDKYGNSVQTKTVTLTQRTWLKITKQPVSVSAYKGKTATVTVGVQGDGLTYKWYYANKGSSKFTYTSSFETNSYSLSMSAARSGRKVYCVITDKYGNSVQTKTVSLTQRTWLKITKQPVSVSAYKGKTATVTVNVQGDGLTYHWYFAEAGSNKFTKTTKFSTKSYYVEMNAARSGRRVYCVITDKYGNTVKTNTVTLKMK